MMIDDMIITWPITCHLTTSASLVVWTYTSFSWPLPGFIVAALQGKIWEWPVDEANLDMLLITLISVLSELSHSPHCHTPHTVTLSYSPHCHTPHTPHTVTLPTLSHSPRCTLYSNPWRNWTIKMGWRRSWLPEGTWSTAQQHIVHTSCAGFSLEIYFQMVHSTIHAGRYETGLVPRPHPACISV